MSKKITRILSIILTLAMLAAYALVPMASAADTTTIYFDNSMNNWSEVAIYTWDASGAATTGDWPGSVMTLVEGNVYSYEVPSDAVNVIFNNNNNGSQTSDMAIPTDGSNLYNGSAWGVYGQEIEVTYILAGSEELCGTAWDPTDTANQLFDEDGDKVYHITYPEVAAGTYEFKVTDGSWNNSWGEYGTSNNYVLTLTGNASVTIQFNSVQKHILADVTYLDTEVTEPEVTEPEVTEPEVTEPVVYTYCLVGYINGANYGCEEDSDNAGEYKFVDGKLTATFTADSYIFVKTEGNAKWFLATAYCTDTTCTFVEGGTEKMLVPGNVELSFTLVENEDGSVTVSYEEAAAECAHEYTSEITAEPTCLIEGTTTYTCSKCGAVYTESIAALGHDYTDEVIAPTCENNGYTKHTCTRCGYYHSTDAVNPIGHNYEKTVVAPTCTAEGYTINTCTNCGNTYNWDTVAALGHTYVSGVCSTCGEADPDYVPEELDYYLFGYINGADYGIGDDLANLGEYKFVDGSLTVKFTETSYVAVKTSDNASFYMTNGYVGAATSATLYKFTDPNSASANKLEVPGNQTVTFTLTENWDGNLIISYTVDTSDCVHTDHNTDGICATCGATVEHTYSSGVCSVCGAIDPDYTAYYDYYLFGYINGANYGCEEDSANLGEYLFVDGKLTVTFDSDSYVGVKEVNPNAKYGAEVVGWYMTDGWQGEATSVTLYDSTTLSSADKLLIPGGVAVTFTLTVNADTLTLSYEASTCEHSYTEEITTAATCTADGVKTFTCSACGHSYTETIAATGHNYVDGTCTVCGVTEMPELETVTIYFDAASTNWSTVNVYAWSDAGTWTAEWPGSAMTLVEGTVYSYEIPVEATKIIFNDGSSQTSDLDIPTDGKNLYTYSTSTWSVYGEETPVDPVDTTYYLVGYINGANYGCDEDYENMGEYKFVDGKLTATFTADSYVFVKTEGNGKWLMADAYCTDTTCTFSEGKTEKMYVPANTALTFTLVENADGSVTVSYVTAAASTVPTLKLSFPTLTFEDMISMNVYFTATDITDVVEMGMITYSSQVTDYGIDTAEKVVPGYTWSDTYQMYVITTGAIAAKDMSDTIYFAAYAKLADGTYAYSALVSYSPTSYAYDQLSTGSDSLKNLMIAMLNYGAEAQTFFSYRTDALMNASLTDAQKASIESYRADMMDSVASVSTTKAANFTRTSTGFTSRYPSISFEGAFQINYYCVPSATVSGNITLYYWNQADFDAVSVLSTSNATGAITMTQGTDRYEAAVTGIAAKDLDKGIYVAFVYSDGTTSYCSGILGYSIGAYCVANAATTDAIAPFAAATAVYGYYAKQFFNV